MSQIMSVAAAPILAITVPVSSAHADPAAPPATAIPEGATLTEAIRAADADLFGLFFEGCDPARLRGMVTENMEFYHDKGGVTSSSGTEFVDQYAKACAARKAPDAWRSRRELVPISLQVDPVPGFGAMEIGEHLFYERQGDGPERVAGRAGFAMVWKHEDGVWKLHRVLSFGHKAAE
jgi:hypothetical protein